MMLFALWEQIKKYARGISMEIRIYADVTEVEYAEIVLVDDNGSEASIVTNSLKSANEISNDLKGLLQRHGL